MQCDVRLILRDHGLYRDGDMGSGCSGGSGSYHLHDKQVQVPTYSVGGKIRRRKWYGIQHVPPEAVGTACAARFHRDGHHWAPVVVFLEDYCVTTLAKMKSGYF